MNPHQTSPSPTLWGQHQVQLNAKDDSIPDALEKPQVISDGVPSGGVISDGVPSGGVISDRETSEQAGHGLPRLYQAY